MLAMRRNRRSIADGDQFQESAGKLDDPVFRTPGMAIARTDPEAETGIELACRIEIGDADDEMVEAAAANSAACVEVLLSLLAEA